MSQDVVVARASGVKLVERQGRLLVVDQRTGWVNTAVFVVGLLTFILTVNGAIQMALFGSGQGAGLGFGLTLCAVAGLVGAVLVVLVRFARRQRDATPEQLDVRLSFDLRAGTLCDRSGQVLAPLANVRLERKFQLTSSAPALMVAYPGGTALIVKGNPFGGGIGAIEQALRGKGIR